MTRRYPPIFVLQKFFEYVAPIYRSILPSSKSKLWQRTLDYLFHDLLPRGGFSATFNFIRDRSRAVRSDFTMQHEMGSIAIECHDRCARFHILGLHLERDRPGSQVSLEEQQLKYSAWTCHLTNLVDNIRARSSSKSKGVLRRPARKISIADRARNASLSSSDPYS